MMLRSRWLGSLLVLTLTGCGASSPAPSATVRPEAPPPAIESSVPEPEPPPSVAGRCELPAELPACAWPVVDAKALNRRVKELKQRVEDSAWKDHASLIELTRVQLLLSGSTSEKLPPTEPALLNAKRALAVDDTPSARLVAGLALLHALLPRAETTASRGLLFSLVEGLLASNGPSGDAAVEQARALMGYHQLITRGAVLTPVSADTELGRFTVRLRDDWESGYRSRAALPVYAPLAMAIRASGVPHAAPLPELRAPSTIAPAAPPITACDIAARSTPAGEAFCKAAEAIARSPSETTAMGVVHAFRDMKAPCAAGELVCNVHVPEALVQAGVALAAAKQIGKSIALLRIAERAFPSQVPGIAAHISDGYHAIGVFDRAATYAVQHAKLKGWRAPNAIRRALLADLALGKPGDRLGWLQQALTQSVIPLDDRRAWAHLAAQTVPESRRERWIASLPEGIRPALPAAASPGETCDPRLACAYVAVLNDPSWSPAR